MRYFTRVNKNIFFEISTILIHAFLSVFVYTLKKKHIIYLYLWFNDNKTYNIWIPEFHILPVYINPQLFRKKSYQDMQFTHHTSFHYILTIATEQRSTTFQFHCAIATAPTDSSWANLQSTIKAQPDTPFVFLSPFFNVTNSHDPLAAENKHVKNAVNSSTPSVSRDAELARPRARKRDSRESYRYATSPPRPVGEYISGHVLRGARPTLLSSSCARCTRRKRIYVWLQLLLARVLFMGSCIRGNTHTLYAVYTYIPLYTRVSPCDSAELQFMGGGNPGDAVYSAA